MLKFLPQWSVKSPLPWILFLSCLMPAIATLSLAGYCFAPHDDAIAWWKLGVLNAAIALSLLTSHRVFSSRSRNKPHPHPPDLALWDSEATQRALLQSLPDLFIHLDRQGHYLRVLSAGKIPLVNPGKTVVGNTIFDVLPTHLATQLLTQIQTALDTQTNQSYEYEIKVNGETRYEETQITPCTPNSVLVVVRDINDRKVAELALQQSEARYRAIVQDQTELICRLLPDFTFSFVNDAYCRYFDVQSTEVIGQTIAARIHPEDREQVIRDLRSLTPSQPTLTTENRVMVNGTTRWTQWNNRISFNDQGHLTEIQTVGRDITELKQTEAALKRSESRFRQLAETVREGFFVFEVDTSHYSYFNAAYINIVGIPSQSSTDNQTNDQGMGHWFDRIHPEDRPRIAQALQQERQGHNLSEEYRFIRPDGEIRWLRSQAFPIRDEVGQIVRIVGTVEDITDRKQTEAALRDNEELFRRAFDDAPIGISLISPNGQFLKANTFYCTLLGYAEAELLTVKMQNITHPADVAADLAGMQQMIEGEIQSFQMEKRYISKQGTIIPVLMQVAPIRDREGTILYFVGHIQDMRERMKVERMKDEFLSVVSHELRTPLTSIRGALGLLESGIFNTRPNKANHMLKIALSNSDRLVRLVNDLLDLERLQSGKVNLVMQECQVADLMQLAVDSVQTIADQSKITLSVTPIFMLLQANPDAIVQTLTNLLGNAIKFSDPGSTIWLKAQVTDGNWEMPLTPHSPPPTHPTPPFILFSVHDQGRGIPTNKFDVIFEQFQQVDASDSRRKGGTGLGLAICRSIVQQHGGHIWVESRLGEGSSFFVALPIHQHPD